MKLNFRSTIFVISILVISIILFSIPTYKLFHFNATNYALLAKYMINGLLVTGFALLLIFSFKLRLFAGLHLTSVYFPRFLVPSILLTGLWLVLQFNSFFQPDLSISTVLFILIVALARSAAEEFIFRGFFQSYFLKNKFSPKNSILLSSGLFSLAHAVNIFNHGSISSMINQMNIAFFFGLLLSAILYSTKNIFLCCIIHGSYNFPAMIDDFVQSTAPLAQPNSPTFIKSILSVLIFTIVYSPLIIVAIYTYKRAISLALENENV